MGDDTYKNNVMFEFILKHSKHCIKFPDLSNLSSYTDRNYLCRGNFKKIGVLSIWYFSGLTLAQLTPAADFQEGLPHNGGNVYGRKIPCLTVGS